MINDLEKYFGEKASPGRLRLALVHGESQAKGAPAITRQIVVEGIQKFIYDSAKEKKDPCPTLTDLFYDHDHEPENAHQLVWKVWSVYHFGPDKAKNMLRRVVAVSHMFWPMDPEWNLVVSVAPRGDYITPWMKFGGTFVDLHEVDKMWLLALLRDFGASDITTPAPADL
jgi:hypothetical protein